VIALLRTLMKSHNIKIKLKYQDQLKERTIDKLLKKEQNYFEVT
jgi:hypothetical protein